MLKPLERELKKPHVLTFMRINFYNLELHTAVTEKLNQKYQVHGVAHLGCELAGPSKMWLRM